MVRSTDAGKVPGVVRGLGASSAIVSMNAILGIAIYLAPCVPIFRNGLKVATVEGAANPRPLTELPVQDTANHALG